MATSGRQRKVKKVMHEYKQHSLKSGGSGRKVKSRRQAIAIAMSESGQSRTKKKGGSPRRTGASKRKTSLKVAKDAE